MNAIALILGLLVSQSYAYSRPVFTYEPAVVDLVGALDLQTFPGPPNYESIQGGDKLERHFYLKLDSPVDVVPHGEHPTVDNPEEERNVQIMQLAIDGEDEALWASFKKLGKGAHVKVTGTLFHRFTGHHHSRVLLSVSRMELIPR
jgi:hypothetical protein